MNLKGRVWWAARGVLGALAHDKESCFAPSSQLGILAVYESQ